MTVRSRQGTVTLYTNDLVYPGRTERKSYSEVESYNGQDNPKWRSLIYAREDATNTLQASRRTISFVPGRFDGVYYNPSFPKYKYDAICDGLITQDTLWPPTDLTATHLVSAQNVALKRFTNKYIDVVEPFGFDLFVGELNETRKLLFKRSQTLLNLLRNTSSNLRKIARSMKSPRKLANYWLETTFGWQPLISDVQSLSEAISRPIWREYRIRDGASDESLTQTILPFSPNTTSGAWTGKYLVHDFIKTKCSLIGLVDTNRAGLDDSLTSRLMGETVIPTLREFVPTAWELLPWSFLVDYFTNIGDILASSRVIQSNFRYVSMSTKSWRDYKRTPVSLTPVTSGTYRSYSYTWRPYSLRILCEKFDRVKPSTFTPSFQLEVPGVYSKQTANIVALLVSRFSTR